MNGGLEKNREAWERKGVSGERYCLFNQLSLGGGY
jgi:hypothetical protein